MKRLAWLLGCVSLLCGGCTLCANPHDCKYAGYGGVRERVDMAHGRVGSVFDPAPEISHVVAAPQSPAEPTPAMRPGVAPDASLVEPDPVDPRPTRRRPADPRPELPELPNGSMELPDLNSGTNQGSENLPGDELFDLDAAESLDDILDP